MFEREIKFIYDFNLNKVNKLGPYFTFEQLASSGIHPAILHYISAEIDYLIFEDRQQLLKNSVFDYSGEKISLLFSQISNEVKHSKRFSLEYVSKLILHASSFIINFLVRPKWTLVKFVFDEGDHKTTSEIKQILNYLYYYKHLKSILVSYITTKKIISMNSEEFKELLNKVDQLGVETYLPSILSGALKSMAEFFNIGEVQKNRIPLVAVKMFLEEKQLTKHLEKLYSVFGEDGNLKFSRNEYQKEFNSVLPEKEEAIPEEQQRERFEPVVVEQHDIDSENKVESEDETKPENVLETKEEVDSENIRPEEPGSEDKNDTNEKNIENEQTVDEVEKTKELEQKSVKIRIKIKENNEIERIESGEASTEQENIEAVKDVQDTEEEKENSLFDNFEENSIVDDTEDTYITPEEPINNETKEVGSYEEPGVDEIDNKETELTENEIFEKTTEDLESTLEENESDRYNEFMEDDEIKEINKYADETLKNIENKLETNEEDEKESVFQSILENESEDIDRHEEDEESGLKNALNQNEDNINKTDLADLLEHKEMTKIIEGVFEYDIEEFSTTLEEIMACQDIEDAYIIINQSLKERGFRRKSKEAQLFKQIISEYFNRR